jgi:hypothetical protein
MPLSPIPSTLPTSTYEHLVLEALNEIAVGSTINYNPPILDTALFRHLVLNALQYIANNPGGAGSVTSITGGSGLSGGTITTSGTLAVIYGALVNTACQGNDSRLSDARTPLSHTHGNISNVGAIGTTANIPIITGTNGVLQASSFGTLANTFCQGNDSRLSDSRSPSGTAGGDLAGTYPNPTVDGLQGTPVSNATPVNGQVLQYDGANWVPGSIPSGGSGGGGVVYYLNFNTAADAPLTNIPQTPNATKELGIVGDVTGTSYLSPILSTGSYDFLASFVTDVSTPSSTTIPAGIWDFNTFVQSTTSNAANQVYFKIEILKYDGTNAPTLIATSNDTYIYDPTEVTQYVTSIVMPQTTILSTDRIVIYLYGKAHQSNNRLTFRFGGVYPSHTHSTIPSVTGTGVAKVVNGVFQSPASTIVNADVSASAAIDVNKLSGVVAKAGDTMTGKLNLPASTTATAGLNLGNGVIPTTTIAGDVFSSGNNIFFKGTTGGPYIFAYKNDVNTFLVPQIISTTSPAGDSTPALRITQAGGGEAFRVEDSSPDTTPFVISTAGKVGIGVTPDAAVALSVDTTGVKFGDGTIQTTAATGSGTVTSVTATSPITSSGGATPVISTSMATNRLLGRSTAATGVAEEIAIGTGLSLSAGTLSNAGVLSDTTAAQGGTQLLNMVQVTQAAYNAIVTPTANTLYIIVG